METNQLFGFLILCGVSQALLEADCPNPCTQGGQKYCHPIPCPAPPCNNSYTPTGACCPKCPPPDCPNPCTQGGKKYCHPIPCPKPPCNNSYTPTGACCPECPPPDCPHPCFQGGHKFCGPIPCPKQPCNNSYTPPWACCDECVKDPDCPHPCTVNGHKFCEPPPCPPPPPTCKNPYTPPGECCMICPNETTDLTGTKNSTDCPFPCEQGGKHYCHPLPCPLQPCVDAITPKGACCPICPNGNNCRIEGHIYPAHKDTIHNGKLCRCFGFSGKCEDIVVS